MKRRNKLTYLLVGVTTCCYLTSCSLLSFTPDTSNSGYDANYVKTIYNFLLQNYYEDIDERALLDGMIYGLTDAFGDPFTYYTSSANGEYQDYSTSGVGLGFARSLYYGEAYVNKVMKNSPAEKAGLKSKDVITKIRNIKVEENQETYDDFYILKEHNYNQWSSVLSGSEGSKIELYIKRLNDSGVYENVDEPLIVTRGLFNEDKTVLKEFNVDEINGFSEAYIEISSFLGNSASGETTPQNELKTIFDQEIFNKVETLDHLIIDLRGNGGGYVSNCIATLGLFIPYGEATGYYQYADGTYEPLINTYYKDQYTSQIDEITLIIDENTASAGESFTVGLRDSEFTNDKINVVGQVSYGKGIAQTFYNLFNDGSLLRYTFAKVCSPSKECINKRGIIPDVMLGEENIPYEEYRMYINGVASNDELSEENKNILINRINKLLQSSFSTLEEALVAFRKVYKATKENEEKNNIYDDELAALLADEVFDNIIYTYEPSVYTGHVEGKDNNDEFTPSQRKLVKEKINFLLGTSYSSFDKAVKAFQNEYNIISEDNIYNKETSDLLQGKVADIHLQTYNIDVIEQVKEIYGSKKNF